MGFSTEFLFEACLNKLRIMEIPMTAHPREYGVSYVKIILILKSILSITLHYFFKKYNLNVNKLFIKKWLDKIYLKLKHLQIFQ